MDILELAKRFKNVDFLVAGRTHFPNIMGSIIKKYSVVPNLKFLGHIDGKEKDELLRDIWAVVNTSVHEAVPVSFLESFAYGKPVISCQNPDNMVGRFGEYVGKVLGDGFDDAIIDVFGDVLNKVISKKYKRVEKGDSARKFIRDNYSHQRFEQALKEIMAELEVV